MGGGANSLLPDNVSPVIKCKLNLFRKKNVCWLALFLEVWRAPFGGGPQGIALMPMGSVRPCIIMIGVKAGLTNSQNMLQWNLTIKTTFGTSWNGLNIEIVSILNHHFSKTNIFHGKMGVI